MKRLGKMGKSKNRRKSNNTVNSNNGTKKTQARPTQEGNKGKTKQSVTNKGMCHCLPRMTLVCFVVNFLTGVG